MSTSFSIRAASLSSTAAIALALSLPMQASAQDNEEDNARRLGTITVTSQKREQSLQDVPLAVTAVSDELIEDSLVTNLTSLSKLSASLTVDAGDERSAAPRIRGVGTNVFSSAIEPSVSVVLDGVVLPRISTAQFDFDDIERIEVLRGPQGTLFGKNASAGLINIVTKAPSDTLTGSINVSHEFEGGGKGDTRTSGSISGPLGDRAGFRLSGIYSNTLGHLNDAATGQKGPDRTVYGFRGKLQFDPTDNLTVTIAGDYQDLEGENFISTQRQAGPTLAADLAEDGIVASPTNRSFRSLGFDNDSSTNKGVSLTAELDNVLGDHSLTSITAYRDFYNFGAIGVPASATQFQVDFNGSPREMQTFSQELQLSSAPGQFEYTVGALYWTNELENDFDRRFTQLTIAGLPGELVQGFDNTVDTTNLGIYGQGTWYATDQLSFTGGLRFTDEEVDVTYSNFRTVTLLPGIADIVVADSAIPDTDRTVDDTDLSGKLAVNYEWNDDISTYASYSRGYRGRAFNLVSSSDLTDLDNPLDAEIANSFEVGLRSVVFNGSTIINATAFHTIFEDFQAEGGQVTDDGAVELFLSNAGELETQGLEVDIISEPTDNLSIFASIAYIDATFNEFDFAPCFNGQTVEEGCIDGFQNLAGAELPNAPEFKATFSGRYEHDIPSVNFDGFLNLGYRWQSDTSFALNQNPDAVQESYGIVDLTAGIFSDDKGYEIALFAKNLFDEDYVVGIGQSALSPFEIVNGQRILNTTQRIPRDAERLVGVRASKRW